MIDFERVVWIGTQEVKTRYGFDPSPYVERVASGERFIRNKLTSFGIRLWVEADVQAHPDAKLRP